MGTSAGAAKARERREEKAMAARRARRAAYEAERRALEVTATMPVHQNCPSDSGLMPETGQNVEQPQHVAAALLRDAAPIAALTVTHAMVDKCAPWAVRLQAAFGVLDSQGLREQPAHQENSVNLITEAQLRAFLEVGTRAIALQRSAAGAEDAERIEEC